MIFAAWPMRRRAIERLCEYSKQRKERRSRQSLAGLNRFKAGFGAQLVDYVGEWDLPLNKNWYWLWTTARPRLVAALKKRKK
jgi:lipid II:glycine glycyltransferase (peptidoglycan interpeptide bridge formation enzyme)